MVVGFVLENLDVERWMEKVKKLFFMEMKEEKKGGVMRYGKRVVGQKG